MRICKHSCGIIRILITYVIVSTNYGYVLSDARFDWLVGNMSAYQEKLFRSGSKKTTFSFICRIEFEKYFKMAIEDYFSCLHGKHGKVPYCLKTSSFPMHASKLKAMQIKKNIRMNTRLLSNSFSKNFLSARISNWENGNFFTT